MKTKLKKNWSYGLLCVAVVCCLQACQKINFRETTTEDVNITGYLDNNPETYSLLSDILYRSKTAGYLGAYGTYTLFAPDNASVSAWIKENGKNSLDDFSEDELLNFVRYHVVRDTINTLRFTDGKIKTPSLFGEFLYTDVQDGVFRVNKAAFVNRANILCGNGWVHGIDHVLVPPPLSLAELVESNAGYAIFTEALKATGFYDTLYYERGMEIPASKRFQTVIVESDAVFQEQGIMDFAQLKEKYSQTGNPKNRVDSLWLFVAYHISNSGLFLEDIISASSIYTLAPKEIISTKLQAGKVLLNDDEFNGVIEPGAELLRANSDVLASNGILHESAQSISIKVRQQTPVYFDVASSSELRNALGGAYRNAGGLMELVANGVPIANSFRFDRHDYLTMADNVYRYYGDLTNVRPYANGDLLDLSVGPGTANRVTWIELKTPYLVKGRYKVWICYAQNGNGVPMQVTFNPGKGDEQILPNVVFFNQTLSASGISNADRGQPNADNLMLAQGYKRYMATVNDYNPNGHIGTKAMSGTYSDVNVGRLAGTIEVETTDRHIIRLEGLGTSWGQKFNTYLDMIQFIPADDVEQIYPRFYPIPGELFYRPQ